MSLADEIRDMLEPYIVDLGAAEGVIALAEARESALVAAAYEAAADACADYPRIAPDATEVQHYDEQIDHSQACIRAMTPADANAALDRMLTEARKEGMREAAGIASAIHQQQRKKGMIGQANGAEKCRAAILAAAEKENGK